jgi:ribosome-associated heat shock protein Hsp15
MKPKGGERSGESEERGSASVRLDKWLWAARFYRTRALAVAAIEAGHVRVNGERAKPSHPIRTTSLVRVRKEALTFDVEVSDVSERRGSAAVAATLYRELPESVAAREAILTERRAARGVHAPSRPTKRERRKLEDFLNEP